MVRLFMLWMVLAFPAVAQERSVEQAIATMPEAQAKRLASDPDRFAAGALRLIYGFGAEGGLTRAAADAAERIDLAERRAKVLVPFLQSDLDNDGTVSAAEVTLRAGALGSDGRARLLVDFAGADGDGDGSVSAQEARAVASAAAGSWSAPAIADLFVFDLDADGSLTVAEVEAVRAFLAKGSP